MNTDKQFPKSDAELKEEAFARSEKKIFPHTDKQPHTVSRWIKAIERLPKQYKVVPCKFSPPSSDPRIDTELHWGFIDRDNNWIHKWKHSQVEWLEEIPNVYIFTPAELEAMKAEWQREAASTAYYDGVEYGINGDPICPRKYIDTKYPLPQSPKK